MGDKVNDAIEALHSGDCLRAIVHIADSPYSTCKLPQMKQNVKMEGGYLKQLSHWSDSCQCEMTFSIFVPELKSRSAPPPPVLMYLSGLTCSDENARTKAHFAHAAAEEGICIVFPDTSPRATGIEGEEDNWDFGTGAGFYVNATQEPWSKHYNMYNYVTEELPKLVQDFFYVDPERQSIMGHSMGGHGALIAHLKNPAKYKSVSALAPISNPTVSHVRQLEGYLGTSDQFMENLRVNHLYDAFKRNGLPIELRYQPLYDHSYFFVSTFMKDHVKFHAKALFQ